MTIELDELDEWGEETRRLIYNNTSEVSKLISQFSTLQERIIALEGRILGLEAKAAPDDEWTLFDGCEPLTWPGWYGAGITNTVMIKTLKANDIALPGDFMLTQHGWVARIFSDADFTEIVDKLNPALVDVYWKHLEE